MDEAGRNDAARSDASCAAAGAAPRARATAAIEIERRADMCFSELALPRRWRRRDCGRFCAAAPLLLRHQLPQLRDVLGALLGEVFPIGVVRALAEPGAEVNVLHA